MLKIAETIIIKSLTQDKIEALQSQGEYDYREVLDIVNSGEVSACVNTNDFVSILGEEILKIEHSDNFVFIETKLNQYRLPIYRERGVFISKSEVDLPKEDPVNKMTLDLKSKSLDTKVQGLKDNLSNQLVIIGENLLARKISSKMEIYGDPNSFAVSIRIPEYNLISKLGDKVNVEVYSNGTIKVTNELSTKQVRIRRSFNKADLTQVVSNLTKDLVATANLSEVKLKSFGKFSLDEVYVSFKTGSVTFTTDISKRVIEDPDLVVDNPFTILVYPKEVQYLVGKVHLYKCQLRGTTFYLVKTEQGEKTVYLSVRNYEGELKW